jgi:tol-pal system protein YbgF
VNARIASRPLRAVGLVLSMVVASGCFATRNDVRLLQDELRAMRAAQQQQDAARRAQGDVALSAITSANDSIRALSARVSKLQTDVSQELHDMGRQLITIQELTGQGQAQLQRLRAQLESRAEQPTTTTPPPVTPGDTSRPGATPATPALPGPTRMLEIGREQLQRGSPGAARDALQELIRAYPESDVVPAAQFFIAEAFAAENERSAADSVYRIVFETYPRSDRAPGALFKLAVSQRAQSRPASARALFSRLINEYPRTAEADLAREQLRTLR